MMNLMFELFLLIFFIFIEGVLFLGTICILIYVCSINLDGITLCIHCTSVLLLSLRTILMFSFVSCSTCHYLTCDMTLMCVSWSERGNC